MDAQARPALLALLTTFSWQELRHHPWRSAAAVLAVLLGVALGFSVHLINASALDEFTAAARSAGGQPDVELRAVQGGFDEALYGRIAADPRVTVAVPMLELQTLAAGEDGRRHTLRVLGLDALQIAAIAPGLMPVPRTDGERLAIVAPGRVFLNPAARVFGSGDRLRVQVGMTLREVQVAGTVAAGGGPLAVMDIGAAQDLFGRAGELTRIDVRLAPGTRVPDWLRTLSLPPDVQPADPGDAGRRAGALSRAYRVNLTVLALVALFTGAFLVFSVQALSVARRARPLALLGVLGLTAGQRLRLVLAESALLGLVGSALGLAAGTGLALLALRVLGGDLGGGYFAGGAPRLQWDAPAALLYGLLGVAAAMVGGWLPARQAAALPLAQSLKGLGAAVAPARRHLAGLALMAAGGLLALLPPVAGVPLAAYLSVGLLLVGGIAALPPLVALVYDRIAPRVATRALALLAVERARRVRESAAVAVSGVVAALSLAVALTVMVTSFRDSVSQWLDVLLPADLYARTTMTSATGDAAFLTPSLVAEAGALPGVARVVTQRVRALALDPTRPPVTLLARPLDEPERSLPLVGPLLPAPAGQVPIYVSEALVDLYGARPGEAFRPLAQAIGGGPYFVAGVWRDYARQSGTLMMDLRAYRDLTRDGRVNELHLWLAPGADPAAVQAGLRAATVQPGGAEGLIEFASAAEIRAISLRIFDRSFAVTYWLQAVAIGIGLFGVAASFSAQVLARRKEFGLLAHLGLTRRQILAVVAGEGAAWTLIGALAGLALGIAVAVVLVHVVNPQSFHWTMDLRVPWGRLALLCAAVLAAGTVTAWLAGRAAATRDAVRAVMEDW